MKPTVLVADDHPIFRVGIVEIIRQGRGFKVVGEAGNGVDAIGLINKLKPDIAVLDISMPGQNGIEVCRSVKNAGIKTSIVILSMHRDVDYINGALAAGAMGYVLKNNTADDIVAALESVMEGKTYVSPSIAWMVADRSKTGVQFADKMALLGLLSKTEKEVLEHISQSKTSKQVAKNMRVSFRTIQRHRANICSKLELKGWNALLLFAMKYKSSL